MTNPYDKLQVQYGKTPFSRDCVSTAWTISKFLKKLFSVIFHKIKNGCALLAKVSSKHETTWDHNVSLFVFTEKYFAFSKNISLYMIW